MDVFGWACCAAVCVAFAAGAACVGVDAGARLFALPERLDGDWVPNATLVLELLAAALEGGQSIPDALRAVGACCTGPCAGAFAAVSDGLMEGASWDEAWVCAPDEPRLAAVCSAVRDALRESWNEGVAAVAQIDAAMEQLDTMERMGIERAASKLSVRLLLPMGLCFLPAFLCIAVIPTIISFIR